MNSRDNLPEIKHLIKTYVERARINKETVQTFAWDQYAEKDATLQREICKWAFQTFEGVKIKNLGWGFSITNIQ